MGLRDHVEGISLKLEEIYILHGKNKRKGEKYKSRIGKIIVLLPGVGGVFSNDFYCLHAARNVLIS